jgi:hypothetical protein
MKTFESHFTMIKEKLLSNENFAFLRFSDGELFILQNKHLELNSDHFIIGDSRGGSWYNEEEQKKFLPDEHQFYRERLIDSLKYKEKNYFRGICTRPDVDLDTFNWQLDLAGGDDDTMTWSNLFINSNYQRYMDEIFPLFKTKKVIMVVNKSAKIEPLKFNIIKDFRVGTNCFINDYPLISEIDKFITENDIQNHVFLISAASLSNLIIHQLYSKHPNNTFIDIGSTLNPLMRMEGWKGSRAYLREFWLGEHKHHLNMNCQW